MPDAPLHASRMSASDRRTQLVDTALDIFSQKGFNGATTREIAAAAGVTEAIIFRHFPTKQALYQAVLESEMGCPGFRKWMAEAQSCMDREDDGGLFRAIATAIVEGYRGDARLERVLLFAALEGHEQGLAHFRSFSMPIFEVLRGYLEKRQRTGAIADVDPGMILTAISGMAQRYATLSQLFGFPSDRSDHEAVETFTHILMNGIQAK
jgi:TetR/AcrR family transcriptional regulator